MNRLGEEDAIDPARARPGDDIGQHLEAELRLLFDGLQKAEIDHFGAAKRSIAPVMRPARPGKLPQLFGHPVHVDCKAHPAVADQCNAEFLLAHGDT